MTTPPQPPPGSPGSTPPEPSPWQPATPQVPPPGYGPAQEPPTQQAPVVPPPPVEPPSSGEPAQPAEPKKGRDYRSLILIAVIVVAVFVAAVLGIELYARQRTSTEVNAATSCLVQDGATASFGPMPLVVQYLGDHIDKLTIRTAGNQIAQAKKMTVAITVRDVSLKKTADSLGTIGRLDVEVSWPTAGITESARALVPGMLGSMIGDATTNESTGEVTLSAAGGLAQITTKPVIKDGMVTLESENVSAFIGLPREIIQPALDTFSKGLVGGQYPMGLKADQVKVTNDGITVNLSSTNQPMKPVENPCLQNLSF
ncbi:MAG: LmeA family phospholipid-binding protein [Mycobacterium sp.]